MNVTPIQLRHQLETIQHNGLYSLLMAAAHDNRLPVAFVVAVASRETNAQLILGDGGHGVGIIQVDVRFHEIARHEKATGSWLTHPETLINYGVRLLAQEYAWANHMRPAFTETQWLKIAADAYNAGDGGALRGIAVGDADKFTAHRDYGTDVLERMEALKRMGVP